MGVGGEDTMMGMEPTEKELTEYLRKLDQLPDDTPVIKPKVEQCQCRTGCPECYGKLNCGCPDCYVPDLKKGKKKKVSLEMMDMLTLPRIVELEYSYCTVSQEEEKMVAKTLVQDNLIRRGTHEDIVVSRRPISCVLADKLRRSRNRWSMPNMDVVIKEKEKQPRRSLREPFIAKDVAPPKQTKYFCRQCKLDICNSCFSTVCSSHTVQWIGSSFFHCASPFHKIMHEHSETES